MSSRMFPYSVFTWFDSEYMFGVSFTGDDTSRAVFLVCLRAQDARHHGRYGPQGIFRALLPRRSHARCVQRQVPHGARDSAGAVLGQGCWLARFVQRHVPMVLETVDGG